MPRQWQALVAPRAPPGTPGRTPTHVPTPPAHRPARPIASSANRHAPAALATLSTILGAAALAGWSPLGTGAAPPGPSHHTARYVTAGSVAATSLLRATMTRAARGTAAPPPPPEPHAAGTTDATPVTPARPPTPGALPYDASPHADHHTDPATSGNTDPTARDHPAPTTDTRVHTAADDPPAPCQGRPGKNSNNAPASEPRSRGTRGPSTKPMPARACTTGALAALVAAATTLALALDTRPHAARRQDAPRRVIRRRQPRPCRHLTHCHHGTMTRRAMAMGACASPTPAPGDDAQRTPGNTDGTPIDLSGDALGDDPPDHDNGSDPPPTEPHPRRDR